MKFWDSSALVPLLVKEKETRYCLKTLSDDQEMLVWCLSKVEVISALCRRLRDKAFGEEEFQKAKGHLNDLIERAYEVQAIEKVRARALRLLEVHPIRAPDACQLAAVLVATQEEPHRLAMVCFDQNLKNAALKEGFIVNP
ncbi:MAG: PIN domain-containing protein [Deltaproteobacteria bacterium]|nr:type II toxin-antitoxin system VapC family toxin [Deltaproteobacteria bacterium]MBW2078297.1 type II toxin-antitoxin system VapC family toxin [Deltaproteobacteria bacterium]MBW2309626.1 type II toxin-antitoxin system VapC family toxin [Deltaproteobacteria bacterium]RLB30487.1 MAG: PIN domain-containing protein [Deltaproteobacteria bacterium]